MVSRPFKFLSKYCFKEVDGTCQQTYYGCKKNKFLQN